MVNEGSEHIKNRTITFTGPHTEADQAQTATQLLRDLDGVVDVHASNPLCLEIRYDLSRISRQIIEELLQEVGFHLDNGLLAKLKRALHYYTECIERENHGYEHDQAHNTRDVFIKRYLRRPHGCRDGRPDYWRRYL